MRRMWIWTGIGVVSLLLAGAAAANANSAQTAPAPRTAIPLSGEGAVSNEGEPAVVYNSTSDEYLVVWTDGRNQATSGDDIYGRRVGGDGTPRGGAFRISGPCPTRDDRAPSLAWNAVANEYLVVWQVADRATDTQSVWGRRVSADGTRLGGAFRIASRPARWMTPRVVWNPTVSEYLVVWERYLPECGLYFCYYLYGQRIGADGSLLGVALRISSRLFDSVRPAVAWNPLTHEYLLAWQGYLEECWQRVASEGRRLGAQACNSLPPWQPHNDAQVACAGTTGECLIATSFSFWDTDLGLLDARVRYTLVAADGSRLRGATRDCFGCYTVLPNLVWNPTSDYFLVVWTQEDEWHWPDEVIARDIYGAREQTDLASPASSFRVSGPEATGSEWEPAVAYNSAADEFLVVWVDDRNAATRGTDIYKRRVPG